MPSLIFGWDRISYFRSSTGRSPRIKTIAYLLSSIRTSSGVRSSRPATWELVEKLPRRPSLRPYELVSIVSFPRSSDTYLWVLCSLPPRYTNSSQFPTMLSHCFSKSAFSCARFCKMMDTLTPRERITESILSKSSGRLTLANSSIRK